MMEIKAYSRITADKMVVNGSTVYSSSDGENINLTDLYRHLGIDYPKFFKMDNLCKAGFLGAETIIRDAGMDTVTPKKDCDIVLFNSTSSLDDDIAYNNTIEDDANYFPSPSVFVYTLANIVTGEIAIRNKIMGESSFYVLKEFSSSIIYSVVKETAQETSANAVLCGWADFLNNTPDVLLMLLQRTDDGKIQFTAENINKLYR